MLRNSTTVFIQTDNIITPLDWNDGSPDFSIFTEPTLSILQGSFTRGLESIEVIPDDAPAPTPQPPDWEGFNAAMLLDESMTAYEVAANAAHPSIVSKKDLAYSVIADKGSANFAAIFPVFCTLAEVSASDRQAWADLAAAHNLPYSFISILEP